MIARIGPTFIGIMTDWLKDSLVSVTSKGVSWGGWTLSGSISGKRPFSEP
jgi:hypothetical protein